MTTIWCLQRRVDQNQVAICSSLFFHELEGFDQANSAPFAGSRTFHRPSSPCDLRVQTPSANNTVSGSVGPVTDRPPRPCGDPPRGPRARFRRNLLVSPSWIPEIPFRKEVIRHDPDPDGCQIRVVGLRDFVAIWIMILGEGPFSFRIHLKS